MSGVLLHAQDITSKDTSALTSTKTPLNKNILLIAFVDPETGTIAQVSGDGQLKVKITESSTISLIRDITTDGNAARVIDGTKNFETDMLINKYVKITINGITYYRKILSNTNNMIGINPIQNAVAASVTLTGVGSIVVRCKDAGVAGNMYSIAVVAGTGESSPETVAWDSTNNILTITSATDVAGVPQDILAGNLQGLFTGVPEVDALFTVDNDFTPGAISLVAPPEPFTGGIDEVAVTAGMNYEIVSL